jgi:hypothetical protein
VAGVPGTEVRPQSHVDTPEWQRFEARMLARRAERRAQAARARRARLTRVVGVIALFAFAAALGFAATWIFTRPWILTQAFAFTAAPPTPPPGIALRINDGVAPPPLTLDSIPILETPPVSDDDVVADHATSIPAAATTGPAAVTQTVGQSARESSRVSSDVFRNGVNERAVPPARATSTPPSAPPQAAAVEPPTAPVTIVPGNRETATPQPPPLGASDRAESLPNVRPTPPESRVDPASVGTAGSAAPAAAPAARSDAPPVPAVDTANIARPIPDARAQIRTVLERYRLAYERLDAGAAGAVWPGVDRRALARAFDGLQSQSIDFRDCRILTAPSTAHATCTGRARAVPKIGNGGVTEADRTWEFSLVQKGNEWQIAKATVR